MVYELYVDSLFLVNFTMNLYLLMLVDRNTFRTACPGRLILGAALGAAVYLLLFLIDISVWMKMILGAAGAVGMIPAAFPVKGFRSLLKLTEKMMFFSFCTGGLLLFLARCIRPAQGLLTGTCGVLCAGGIAFLFFRRFAGRVELEKAVCTATLVGRSCSVTVSALIDSGNGLVEPISGKPVSVIGEDVFRKLWDGAEQGFRVIPYRSIGKRKGILKGYILPELELEIDGIQKTFHDIYVAVSPEELPAGTGFAEEAINMIINPRLLTEEKNGKLNRKVGRNHDLKSNNTRKNAVFNEAEGKSPLREKGGDPLHRRDGGVAAASGGGAGKPGDQRSGDRGGCRGKGHVDRT